MRNKKQTQLFNHYELSTIEQDVKSSKQYETLTFPKLRSPLGQSQNALDNIWLIGCLDHQSDTQSKERLNLDKLKKSLGIQRGSMFSTTEPILNLQDKSQKLTDFVSSGLVGKKKKRMYESLSAKRGLPPDWEQSLKEIRLKQKKHSLNDRNQNQKTKVYATEAKRLEKAVRLYKLKVEQNSSLYCDSIESYLSINKMEFESARILHRFFKRIKGILRTRRVVMQSMAAILIQKNIRRYLVMKLVSIYESILKKNVVIVQKLFRGCISRKKTFANIYVRVKRALIIQSFLRRHFAKIYSFNLNIHRSAKKIQKALRSYLVLISVKEAQEFSSAVKIQKIFRGCLVRKHARNSRFLMEYCCVVIQKCFRSFSARLVKNHLLVLRSFKAKRFFIQMIKHDIIFKQQEIDKLLSVNESEQSRNITLLQTEIDRTRANILQKEEQYISYKRDLLSITIKDIATGWKDEIALYIKEHREHITKLKLEFIFELSLAHNIALRVVNSREKRRINLQRKIERLDKSKDNMLLGLIVDQTEYQKQISLHLRLRSIGAEKRKWKVKEYDSAGKPVKLKVNQHPHDSFEINKGVIREKNNEFNNLNEIMKHLQTWVDVREISMYSTIYESIYNKFLTLLK